MLTPERRAELREYAAGIVGVEQTSMLAHPAEMLALLDAADEADRLQDVERRLAVLLCNLTGGKLSKTDYPVELMEQEIEEYLAGHHESDLRDERDRLAEAVERIEELATNAGYLIDGFDGLQVGAVLADDILRALDGTVLDFGASA